jgi:hypothetical protein
MWGNEVRNRVDLTGLEPNLSGLKGGVKGGVGGLGRRFDMGEAGAEPGGLQSLCNHKRLCTY